MGLRACASTDKIQWRKLADPPRLHASRRKTPRTVEWGCDCTSLSCKDHRRHAGVGPATVTNAEAKDPPAQKQGGDPAGKEDKSRSGWEVYQNKHEAEIKGTKTSGIKHLREYLDRKSGSSGSCRQLNWAGLLLATRQWEADS